MDKTTQKILHILADFLDREVTCSVYLYRKHHSCNVHILPGLHCYVHSLRQESGVVLQAHHTHLAQQFSDTFQVLIATSPVRVHTNVNVRHTR